MSLKHTKRHTNEDYLRQDVTKISTISSFYSTAETVAVVSNNRGS